MTRRSAARPTSALTRMQVPSGNAISIGCASTDLDAAAALLLEVEAVTDVDLSASI